MAEIESKISDLHSTHLEKSTCTPAQAFSRTYPWLPTEWVNGTMSFETHFQDYEIENPAVVLQEALGGVVKWLVEGIKAELGAVSAHDGEHVAVCTTSRP
ncbi:hypothetical protein PV05_08035 [Exophiala xenobiotica]|uniref:Uncharacterized protein n=1 Tax=Exophiala xenobiotica TaxID=348802 RepID=A0A0D2ECG6_9EURO|nr:uncharacterized protein PV05_08035 [Exophiala xenobiotica]KIW52395.1 hypothetical protein PV05_08035 [Exophiala xenobiotica]